MSGYTTKLTLRNAINKAKEENPEDEQLNVLLDELRNIRIDKDQMCGAENVKQGQEILDWIAM
jgi:hypothetical protein